MDLIEKLYLLIEEQNLWLKEIALERNQYLKVSGSVDTNLYFVVSGSFRVFVMDGFEENTIRFGYQNNFLLALDSFITQQPSDLFIQALKKSSVKMVSRKDYLNLIRSSTQNQELWEQLLLQLVLQQMERERDILTTSPLERYQRVLQRSPQLFQEIPNKFIASYLRMTPETLSRMKKS